MKDRYLSPLDRAFVEEARGNTTNKVAYQKLSVLVMLDEGMTLQMIAISLGIGTTTVSNCKSKYESEGLDKYLDTHYVPYQGKLNSEQLAMLAGEITSGLYSSCAQINDWIEKQFGFAYSESGLRSVLNKLGFTYKKTTSVPGNLNVAEQLTYLEQMEPFLSEVEPDREVVVFMDAVHPQHNTRSDYVWAKRGEDKEVRSNTGRNRININAAMSFHQPQEVTMVESDCINAQSTKALFEALLQKYADKETIWVFADNARYYCNADLKVWLEANPKIKMLHLPPYSPNLNLIERLWKFMRKKVINLKYYPKFEEFQQAIRDFFQNLEQYKMELKSLITPNFQRFAT
jgi:transposase